jgi:hypothetical protein
LFNSRISLSFALRVCFVIVVNLWFPASSPASYMPTANIFGVKTGAATPKGLGLDAENIGGNVQEAGGEDDLIQCSAAKPRVTVWAGIKNAPQAPGKTLKK